MRSPSETLPPQAGVTLLEVLVVMVIMALAMGLVVPAVGAGGAQAALKADSRALLGAARLARQQAILEERETVLVVDLRARTWAVPGISGGLSEGLAIDVTADRAETGRDTASVRFLPDGSSTGGEIVLKAGEATRTVRIDWLTGHATLR
ncbi:MAG TPA: GspH/FimT family pseudopilin [Azospirillaceae bacterium]|nr:GspH/FimT family pseudopilin [Azospirillaceae bacterium]